MSGNEKIREKRSVFFCDVFFAIKTKNKLIRLRRLKIIKALKSINRFFIFFWS